MVRFWQWNWQALTQMSQHNPPRFVETLMLLLASTSLLVLALGWQGWQHWPYAVLSLSYGIGASISLLVREVFIESAGPRLTPPILVALVFLLIQVLGLGYIVNGAIAASIAQS